MVELFYNMVGPSTHLHGTEEHSWKALVDDLDLTDLYFTAVHRKRPVFT